MSLRQIATGSKVKGRYPTLLFARRARYQAARAGAARIVCMSHHRPEISHWLFEKGYAPGEIEKILDELDRFDSAVSRESLFDDLASGDFDIQPVIDAALKEK